MRRLLAITAILSAALALAALALWLRAFFASDFWCSQRYTASASSLESHYIIATDGWIVRMKDATVLPSGAVPQSPRPMDGSWFHYSGSPGTPPFQPRPSGWLFFSHTANLAPTTKP